VNQGQTKARIRTAEPLANAEMEQALLGCLLVSPHLLDDLREEVSPDDFYWTAHRLIYQAILGVADAGLPVDYLTVTRWLKERGELDHAGGVTFIANLYHELAVSANAKHYTRAVKEKAILRNLTVRLQRALQDCHQPVDDLEALLDQIEEGIFEITAGLDQGEKEVWPWHDLALQEHAKLQKLKACGGLLGITSGYVDLDYRTLGFQNGDSIILAGRPGMGKTALGLNICYRAAESGVPTAFISLEMAKEQLTQRLMSLVSEVDHHRLRNGKLAPEEEHKLEEALQETANLPLYILERSHLTPQALRSCCRKLYRLGVRLVVLDYLQLMTVTGEKNREQEIACISRSIKGIAKELNIPIITLAQLNRQVENREDKRPRLSDLRESGSLEADADLVLLLYRDEVYRKDSPKAGIAEVIIAKHRNGPIGTLDLVFRPKTCRFEDYLGEK